MEKRVTRSNSNTRRDPEETEGAFWGRVIDPVTIERGQAEAIRTVRRATSGDPTALLNTTQNEQHEEDGYQSQPINDNQGIVSLLDEDVPNNLLEEEMPFTSNLTNYTEQSSQILQAMRTAFVDNTPSTTGSRDSDNASKHEYIWNEWPIGPHVHKTVIAKKGGYGSGHATNEGTERGKRHI